MKNTFISTISYWPGRESNYTRNRVILGALRSTDFSIIDCSSNIKNPLRYCQSFLKFLFSFHRSDIIIIGFWGHLLVPLARIFTKKPIIFDSFVSTYMTVCLDRKRFKPTGFMASLAKFIDKQACQMADIIMCDTQEHIDFFINSYGLNNKKFIRLWVGSDETIMKPSNNVQEKPNLVHFHGEFQPLHGVDTIIHAAAMLPSVQFRLIGKGKKLFSCKNLCKKLNLNNVEFLNPAPYQTLSEKMQEACICLGIFGSTIKTQTVIPHKVFEALAVERPIITANTPASRELLKNQYNAILCEPNNPKELAKSIELLLANKTLRSSLAFNGHKTFIDQCSIISLGKELKKLILTLNKN